VSGVAADPVAGNVVGESAKPDFYQEMGGRGALDGAAVANQWSWGQEGVLGAILSRCGHVPTLGVPGQSSADRVLDGGFPHRPRPCLKKKKGRTMWAQSFFGATTW